MKNRKSSPARPPFTLLLLFSLVLTWATPALAQLETLLQQPLGSVDDGQFTLLRITLAPGTGNDGSAPGHRHPGDTIVYVESGTVTNQMNEEDIREYEAGDFWVEHPGDLHAVFRNNDPEVPAVVIVFMVNHPDEPLTVGE